MTDPNETARLVAYMPIIVRDGGISDWERNFCASIISQDRKGRTFSEKQIGIMARIVSQFQEREMKMNDDIDVIEEGKR